MQYVFQSPDSYRFNITQLFYTLITKISYTFILKLIKAHIITFIYLQHTDRVGHILNTMGSLYVDKVRGQ